MGGETVTATGITGTAPAAISDVTGLSTALSTSIRASDVNLAGWTFPTDSIQGGTVLTTGGLSYVLRLRVFSTVVTNLVVHFTVGGTTLTAGQCFASLHNDAGALLGAGAVTADQQVNWQSGGLKVMPLVVPQATTPGAFYKMRFWINGTTGPSASRGISSNSVITNAGLAPPNLRYATADTGLTTLASAPNNIGTQTGIPIAIWGAVS